MWFCLMTAKGKGITVVLENSIGECKLTPFFETVFFAKRNAVSVNSFISNKFNITAVLMWLINKLNF